MEWLARALADMVYLELQGKVPKVGILNSWGLTKLAHHYAPSTDKTGPEATQFLKQWAEGMKRQGKEVDLPEAISKVVNVNNDNTGTTTPDADPQPL